MSTTQDIEVVPYNPEWPHFFAFEAELIQKKLDDACLAIHHVGSTSVPGLAAKPKIDIIAVVVDPAALIPLFEAIGYFYKGEYNIPLHYGFAKRGDVDVNLHVYEEGHPEIELNLLFRDYLRAHPDVRDEYAALKYRLLDDPTSFEKKESAFTGYNLGKDAFIRRVIEATGFNRIRLMKCTHYAEWKAAKSFRKKYFFEPAGIVDPYEWTFKHPEHEHLVLYQGSEVIGYTHLQLWPEQRVAMRMIVIDEEKRNQGAGSIFLALCEKWLQRKGCKSIHAESRQASLGFYRKNGYSEMAFHDPDGYEAGSEDIAVGKVL
ncbi:MAG: GNAT family N-acetyltransferase [Alphaproteobacteria bacterium]|jgi:GrpB-like predicted nucleotidyltransferase (UPF0157 family)|nr:GNAT family N-acetyltransferase [Alphaproteobacteria bacterium]MBP9877680.1 GNAT family N-acetyltransferase [Alphaproteobacteria bacterium]